MSTHEVLFKLMSTIKVRLSVFV